MNIFQVTGYSNSGKTTLLEAWIKQLTTMNRTVSIIKHHGHEQPLECADLEKDSGRFRSAGAENTVVVSRNEFQWIGSTPAPLEAMVDLVAHTSPDVLLIEGYKGAAYPKAVLVRNAGDRHLVGKSKNVQAIVCWEETDVDFFIQQERVAIHIHDTETVIKTLTELVFGGDHGV
ncbi:molybdopterin-guanine dinucleotide biosynthesis protein B [Alteribacter aurantiacus]|uniref:molybdopterin-guanine dinucleotide biosynthesis protein B n=1 Tax=Alteribacter aurantiacus TaxID=254410 RepID=UPI0003FCFE00|nr:molybdopterin-guanine dinucleotide biosynthesis protein B [Alteribacter aurantiacus]